MSDYPRTFPVIRACVAESLARAEGEVRLDSRLVGELGADSLDFIDLIFVLEKRFGVKLREDELDFLSRLDLTDPTVFRDGFLTEATVAQLAEWLPALLQEPDRTRVTPRALFALITVETLCILVERKLPSA